MASIPAAGVILGIVTPIRSTAMIPTLGNQSGGSAAPATEGLNTRGKGIMTDAAAASSVGASRLRVSSGLAPSFREFSGDAIHRDFFPFSSGPYYPTYPEGGIAGNCEFTREEWDAPHQPTLTVLTKERQVTRLNDKLFAFDASFSKSKAKGKERKKKIKSLTKSLDNLHAEVVCVFADLNRATVLEAEKDKEILRLKATPPAFSSFFRGQFQALKISQFVLRAQDRLAKASPGSECVSFGPGNVVVALSAREKGDGYAPSSTVEEVVAPPFGV
nr:hypothetical protein [Tanacetum cinerariifolium]